MTKTELNAFRKTLENSQADLGKGKGNREALAMQASPDELDRIQLASERDIAIGNLERDATINPKRLAAIPWASSCIVCQEAADREPKAHWTDIDAALVMAA